ncbi:hypothetical protein DER44DRAFT_867027 [Fusarium oxysporum]|nr:hypothetical protein DER44DRAFT_867027 [Fusarium oxysporum]
MQGTSSLSTSSASGYRGAVNAKSHFASLKDREPQRLHDVNKDLWQWSFQSVMASTYEQFSTFNLSLSLPDYSSTTFHSGCLPQPLLAHVCPNQDTPSQFWPVPPAEPATTGPEFQDSPIQDTTPAQVQSHGRCGSRPFSCPDCRIYTTNRKYNMNRHRESRHGKARSSDSEHMEPRD